MARIWAEAADELTELHAARRDLLRVLEALGPNDWDKPTLCARWRVRHVVSHLAATPDTGALRTFSSLVRARGDAAVASDATAQRLGARPVSEILDHYRDRIDNDDLPPRVTPGRALADVVVHSLDICQPNGWELELPVDRVRHVLSELVSLGPPVGGLERCTGLHLDTTDIDWRSGCGDHVRGPSRSMVLALAGRISACDQLDGAGVAILANRS